MKLYEYEGKEIFKKMGIPVPRGFIVSKQDKIGDLIDNLQLPLAIKAQIYAGKRGKGGGILFADTKEEAVNYVRKLLGKKINGMEVKEVLIEEKKGIKKELYAAVLSNLITRKPVAAFSGAGGMDVEEAMRKGEKVACFDINIFYLILICIIFGQKLL